jgi:xanthine/CO dehydrogenase XdhC/CoxF family maturation factor
MQISDDDILKAALAWHAAGEAVALATVVETWGSAQCPPGSRLAIDGAGRFVGSLSGGCVEAEVVRLARGVMTDGAPRLCEFQVCDATAQSLGLPCGGAIKVFIERVA